MIERRAHAETAPSFATPCSRRKILFSGHEIHGRNCEWMMKPDINMDVSGWLVVNTQPHKELYAVQQLLQQGYTPYCPLIHCRIKHARRAQDVKRPMFPSYIFVDYAISADPWRPIMSTFGVRRLLTRGGVPDLLDEAFIQELRSREVDGVVRRSSERLKLGQLVAVDSGPFDGMVGEIVELKGSERVAVMLSLLNNKVKTYLSADNLRTI